MIKYTKEELDTMDPVEIYQMILKGDSIKKFPKGFWQNSNSKENAAKCTKYLIEDILRYDDETIKSKISTNLFNNNKLSGMLKTCFDNNIYEAINNAYPNKYKEWELKYTPNGYWNIEENKIKAIKWLIEEKLKFNDKKIKQKLSQQLFIKNGLGGMLLHCFKGSPYEALNYVYPNRFKEWELSQTQNKFWKNKENGIKATKWLIEEKLKLSDDEIKLKISVRFFAKYGLSGMLQHCFNGSPYEAINSAYPNKFKPFEFNNTPKGYWKNKENAIEATKWLIEEKLKLNDDELKEQLSQSLFSNNKLSSMLQYCFNGSPYEAINCAYPNKFKIWEFKKIPPGYWDDKQKGIDALKWLIEEHLKLTDIELKEKISKNFFKKYKLFTMLKHCFNSNIYEAINTIYPNKFKVWEFLHIGNNYWNKKENGVKATKWLIEEKLKLNDIQLKEQLSINLFKDNFLGHMIKNCFDNNPYKAINSTYPNKFKKKDFKLIF